MTFYFVKLFITALVIVVVSEVAKKSSLLAAIIISLPLTSLLAFYIGFTWNQKMPIKL